MSKLGRRTTITSATLAAVLITMAAFEYRYVMQSQVQLRTMKAAQIQMARLRAIEVDVDEEFDRGGAALAAPTGDLFGKARTDLLEERSVVDEQLRRLGSALASSVQRGRVATLADLLVQSRHRVDSVLAPAAARDRAADPDALSRISTMKEAILSGVEEIRSAELTESDDALASAGQAKIAAIVLPLLCLIVVFTTSVMALRSLKGGVATLEAATQRMARGDLTTPLRIREMDDELSVLAGSFEKMREDLAATMAERDASHAELSQNLQALHEAQTQLIHAGKLESVGRLASGIAHELNTPIQFVSDSVTFMRSSFEDVRGLVQAYEQLLLEPVSGARDEAVATKAQTAREGADWEYLAEEFPKALTRTLDGTARLSAIVRAMKEFAHPDRREKQPADLNRGLETTTIVARNEYKYVADLTMELADLPAVVCHIGDLNQVFLNLIVNASHAIADAVGSSAVKGRILVRTVLESPNTVLVQISDTGAGIPDAVKARMFEPFFTTKGVGKGTGQGLALARSIVADKHKGTITFDSEVGRGTTFSIRIPVDGGVPSPEALGTTEA